MRYAKAPSEPAEIAEGCPCPSSPVAIPATARSAAPQSICIAVERNGALGSGATRAYAEPAAQANAPASSTAARRGGGGGGGPRPPPPATARGRRKRGAATGGGAGSHSRRPGFVFATS